MDSTMLSKSSTNCITFRIPNEKLNQLHKESEAKQISFNTLINQLIKEHIDWHSLAACAKLYHLPKAFLIRIISEFTEQELSELARDLAKNDLVDISLFLRGRFTIGSLFDITETWLEISRMPYRNDIKGSTSKIVIQHDMGFNYSYLIKEISRYLLEVAFEANASYDITDDTLVIKIENSSS
jgi:hypothetical protein